MTPLVEVCRCEMGVILMSASNYEPGARKARTEDVTITVRQSGFKPRKNLADLVLPMFIGATILWLLAVVLPAFFDGRVAAVTSPAGRQHKQQDCAVIDEPAAQADCIVKGAR